MSTQGEQAAAGCLGLAVAFVILVVLGGLFLGFLLRIADAIRAI